MKLAIHHFEQNGHGIFRFSRHKVIGVYDERKELQGKDAGDIIGIKKTGIIITGNFNDIIKLKPDLIITGGEGLYFTKPNNIKDWGKNVKIALENGISVYSMSKIFYGNKTNKFRKLAKKNNCEFSEASDPNAFEKYEKYALKAVEEGIKTPVICFSGTNMNSGKITAMFTVKEYLEKKGKKVGVVGTEPSSEFMGADEQVVPEVMPTMRGAHAILGAIKKIEKEKGPDIIFVGGQTGLRASVHDVKEARAGSVVAWQIMLGSRPDKIVLCSKWKNTEEIRPHLELIKNSINADVPAIVINGHGCDKGKLKEIINKVEKETGKLCFDVISTPEKIDKLADLLTVP